MRNMAKHFCLVAIAVLSRVASAENAWTYYGASDEGNPTNVACVVKGEWGIVASSFNSSKGTITLAHVFSDAEDGILDLRDMVVNGTQITGLEVPQYANAAKGNWDAVNIVEFYANNLVSYSEPFGRNQSSARTRVMHIASDTMTAITGRYCNLTNLVINMPNATTWSANLNYCSLTNDVADIIPPGITNITTSPSLGDGVTGTLVLTNLHRSYVGSGGTIPVGVTNAVFNYVGSEFTGQPLRGLSLLKDFTFIAPACTNVAVSSYTSGTFITNLVLYIPSVCVTNSLMQWPVATSEKSSIWFQNAAPTNIHILPLMVGRVPAVASTENQDKWCTIYCSKKQGWRALASPLEGDYEPDLAPEGCFGVCTNSSGGRVAWMVHRASPYEGNPGLAVIVR